jgi:hypothetical protein
MTATYITEPTDLYRATPTVSVIDVPPQRFLMVDGTGGPDGSAFGEAIHALYAVSYALRFAAKAEGHVYKVGPLEALWWSAEADPVATVAAIRAGGRPEAQQRAWQWTAMIVQPRVVTDAMVAEVLPATIAKKHLPAGPGVRLETLTEGVAAQVLHLGAYADEPATVGRLHRYLHEHGYRPVGRHHEIYLGDPRRTEPQRLRTILRQPVEVGG